MRPSPRRSLKRRTTCVGQVEAFHRELKPWTGSEKCQCRKGRSQRNHLAVAITLGSPWKVHGPRASGEKTALSDFARDPSFSDYLRAGNLGHLTIRAFSPTWRRKSYSFDFSAPLYIGDVGCSNDGNGHGRSIAPGSSKIVAELGRRVRKEYTPNS